MLSRQDRTSRVKPRAVPIVHTGRPDTGPHHPSRVTERNDEPFGDIPRAVLGPVPVLWVDRRTALEETLRAVVEGRKLHLAFCNAHTMRLAHRDHAYASLLRRLTVLNDGVGMNLAARMIHGRRFPSNLNGTDFVPELLACAPAGTRTYLLGARPHVVARAAEAIGRHAPELVVVGHRDGYFADDEVPAILADIAAAKPDILLVALGNPKQEQFVATHAEHIAATVTIAVGALFDFMAGEFPRAPRVLRSMGLEWSWRLLQEPGRLFERYTVGNTAFLWHTLKFKNARKRETLAGPPPP